MRIGCKRFICTGMTIWVTMLLLKTHHDNMGSHMVAFTSVTAWIDSPFLAQVTYTCVSISAGGHAPCSAPYSRREPLVDPENSAAPPLLRLYWLSPPSKMQAGAADRCIGRHPKCRRGRRIGAIPGENLWLTRRAQQHLLCLDFIAFPRHPKCRRGRRIDA